MSLAEEMFADGYRYYVPITEAQQRALFVDQQIANTMKCIKCESHTHYEGFSKNGHYRAFAECNVCGNWEEI